MTKLDKIMNYTTAYDYVTDTYDNIVEATIKWSGTTFLFCTLEGSTLNMYSWNTGKDGWIYNPPTKPYATLSEQLLDKIPNLSL